MDRLTDKNTFNFYKNIMMVLYGDIPRASIGSWIVNNIWLNLWNVSLLWIAIKNLLSELLLFIF